MGRFALRSRNKAPSALDSSQPMSKAHKILGSTPINIDSPRLWDDGSSGFSASTAESTVPSYADDEDGHHVAIARSEGEFVEDHDKLSALLGTTAYPMSALERQGMLRKTHSSGAMRKTYNRNGSADANVPPVPSFPHQTDALGIQSSTTRSPRPEVIIDERSVARKGSLPQMRTDDMYSGAHQTKSPSFFTSFMSPAVESPKQPKRSQSKKIQKRRIRDAAAAAATYAPRPNTAGTTTSKSTTTSSREAPDLYDHYEQMSFRHILQGQLGDTSSDMDSQTSESLVADDVAESKELQTALSPKSLKAEPVYLNNLRSPSIVTSSTLKAPASSKPKTKAVAEAGPPKSQFKSINLQEQSMLMLSDSDSDDEDDFTPPGPSRAHTEPMGQPPNMLPASPAKAPRPANGFKSPVSPISPKGGKRTSFAPANTYITIPSSAELNRNLDVDSDTDSEYSQVSSTLATIRAASMKSDGTFGPPSIQEQTIQEDAVLNDFSDTAETHQGMSSPISPKSVNSVSRSVRSSGDGPNSRNRVLASIRRFELMNPHSPRNGRYSFGDDPHMTEEEDEEAEAIIAEYDFDFPAPPSAHQSTASRRQSQRYTLTESVGSNSRPPSQTSQPLRSILKKASIISVTTESSDPTREEITVYLEDREPSPDLKDFLDPDGIIRSSIISESSDRYTLPAVSYDPKAPNSKQHHPPLHPNPPARSASGRLPGNMTTVHEVEENEADVGGLPRPDSPISPNNGISTPTFGGRSRLSVVGSKPIQTGLLYDANNVI